jgi:hypothetical protein
MIDSILLLIDICLAALLGICATWTYRAIRISKDIRLKLGPRYPKRFPIPQQGDQRFIDIPNNIQNSQRMKCGDKYCVLFLSSNCPVCGRLLPFLKYNKHLFKDHCLYIGNPFSTQKLERYLGTTSYYYIDDKKFAENFDLSLIPIAYVVQNGYIVERLLVNFGDEMLAILGIPI